MHAIPSHHRLLRLPRRRATAVAAALALLSPWAQAQVYNWSSGTYTPGVTGPATLLAGETLNINNGGFKYFDTVSGTFTVQGTVNWNTDPLYLQGSSVIANQGLWQSWDNTPLAFNGGTPSFLNTGTFRKAGGTGVTTVQANTGFVNRGTIEAASGRIDFLGGTRFEAGSVFAAGGDVRLASGSHAFAGAYSSAGSLLLAGGSFSGDAVVASGSTRWTGGTLSGSFSNAAGAEWQIGDGAFKYISGAGTLFSNDGTVRWGADTVYLQSAGQVLNRGSWLVEGNLTLANNGGGGLAFVNEGLLHKTAGAGNATVQAGTGFVNRGTLQVDSGALVFLGGASFESGSVFAGAGQVRSAGNNRFVGLQHSDNLVLDSGTHLGEAAELRGSTLFESGYIQGGWTLAAGHALHGKAGGFKYLDGAGTVLTNRGTLSWDTAGALYLQNGSELVNEGLFVATVGSAVFDNGGVQPTFRNSASGTVRAAAGQQLVFGSNLMVNDGGLIEAEAGASVLFNAGASFNDGTRFAGAGLVRVTASASFAGTQTGSNLVLDGGSFVGSAAVVDGTATLASGRFQGAWTLPSGSTLRGVAGGFKYLDGAGTVLTNQGLIRWETGNFWYLESGARLVNEGVFRAEASTALADNGGADPLLELAGSGRVEVAAGHTLALGVPLISSGRFEAEAGASIEFQGRAQFNDGTRFTGEGRNLAVGNNSYAGTLLSQNLTLQGGTHTGGAVRLEGSTRFTGGTMAGTWQVAAGSQLAMDAAVGFRYLEGAASELHNEGLVAFGTAGDLYLQNGATLRNTGMLALVDGARIFDNGGVTPVLRNEGLMSKADGSGAATIGNGVELQNLGTIAVGAGTLNLPANWTNEGRLTGTGTLASTGTFTNAGVIAPGASPGTLTISSSLALGGAGSFEAELENLGSHDLLLVNGPITLGGTLALQCFAACSYAVGDVITLIDSTGNLTGSFAAITLSGFATGAFEPIYDTVADRFQLRVTEAVTAVPEPRGMALMLGGLLALGWLRRRRVGLPG